MTKSQRSNLARDRERKLTLSRREPRVFTPAASDGTAREPAIQAMIDRLSREEMDNIRKVELLKYCGICRKLLDTKKHFHKDDREPSGWRWDCKSCRRTRAKEQAVARRRRIQIMIWGEDTTNAVS